jgi:hypothetical protein
MCKLGVQIGVDMVSNVLKEFWPGVKQEVLQEESPIVRKKARQQGLRFQLAGFASTKILAGHPELPHHGIQGRAMHPERVDRSTDHTIDDLQKLSDVRGKSLRRSSPWQLSQIAVGAATALTSIGIVLVPPNQYGSLLLSSQQLQVNARLHLEIAFPHSPAQTLPIMLRPKAPRALKAARRLYCPAGSEN